MVIFLPARGSYRTMAARSGGRHLDVHLYPSQPVRTSPFRPDHQLLT